MKRILLLACLLFVTALVAVPRDMVVVEFGTGTWCTYCPGAAMGADDLIANGKNVAVVEYHGGDAYENTAGAARTDYYSMIYFPTAVFDGLTPVEGGDHSNSLYSSYLPLYNNRYSTNSPVTISATAVAGETNNQLMLTVAVNKSEPVDAASLALFTVVTESDIHVNWQGQSKLDFVERGMYPGADGTPVDFSTGDTQTYQIPITLASAWVKDNLEVVVFLQNLATKEVYQGVKYSIGSLLGLSPVSLESIDFGTINIDETATQNFTVRNYYNRPIKCDISINNDMFFLGTAKDPQLIASRGSIDYQLFALLYASGDFNTNMTIHLTYEDNTPVCDDIVIPVHAQTTSTANEDNTASAINHLNIYPNPVTNFATIRLDKAAKVRHAAVYNLKGEKVFDLSQGKSSDTMMWNGVNQMGQQSANGVYFVRISTDQGTFMQKLMLVK